MRNLFVLFLALLCCLRYNESKVKNDNNIFIKNSEFKTVIKNFYKDALYFNPNLKNNIISVSFYKYYSSDEVTNIVLYSFKKLNGNLIGETNLDSLKIFFYTDNIKLTKDFIDLLNYIKPKKEIKNIESNLPPVTFETYEKFYIYKDSKLALMKIK